MVSFDIKLSQFGLGIRPALYQSKLNIWHDIVVPIKLKRIPAPQNYF